MFVYLSIIKSEEDETKFEIIYGNLMDKLGHRKIYDGN